jgi:hypothetical protein
MNSMRIIGASNKDIKAVNRVTYAVDTNEVVAYVNKSTLLGRYPNLSYAYEAVRGAMMRCNCKDMVDVITKPVDVISTHTLVPTVGAAFSATLSLEAVGPIEFVYLTNQTRFEGVTAVPIVLFPVFEAPPQVKFCYKISSATIIPPGSPAAALADGFTIINSGDSILIPTGNPTNNRWFLRIAPLWDVNDVFTAPSFTFRLFLATRPSLAFGSFNVNFT